MRFCKPKGLLSIIKQLSIMTIIYCWRQPNDECGVLQISVHAEGLAWTIHIPLHYTFFPSEFLFFFWSTSISIWHDYISNQWGLSLREQQVGQNSNLFFKNHGSQFYNKNPRVGSSFLYCQKHYDALALYLFYWSRRVCGFVPRGLYVEIIVKIRKLDFSCRHWIAWTESRAPSLHVKQYQLGFFKKAWVFY